MFGGALYLGGLWGFETGQDLSKEGLASTCKNLHGCNASGCIRFLFGNTHLGAASFSQQVTGGSTLSPPPPTAVSPSIMLTATAAYGLGRRLLLLAAAYRTSQAVDLPKPAEEPRHWLMFWPRRLSEVVAFPVPVPMVCFVFKRVICWLFGPPSSQIWVLVVGEMGGGDGSSYHTHSIIFLKSSARHHPIV